MADPGLLGASAAMTGVVIGALSASAVRRTRRTQSTPTDTAVRELALASARQAEAMHRLAVASAEGMRAATGTYVFQLRDRFDEALPPVQIGVSATTWSAQGEAPGPLELLVLHPQDTVRFTATLVCNQAPLKRIIGVRVRDGLADGVRVRDIVFTASATRTGAGSAFELPADHSLWIEVPIDVSVASLAVGALRREASIELLCADRRPEGAVSRTTVRFEMRGVVVPDDDGVGIDAADLAVEIGSEERSYYLDKAGLLPLAMPSVVSTESAGDAHAGVAALSVASSTSVPVA